jgi:septal ring factor EnvC (AmiA/AmiB activator)
MSEPITPKAEQHVVEGEFVEAPNKAEAAKDEKAPGKPIAWPQPLGLWLAVMLVSGAALALALSSWVTLQRPDPSAQLAQQLSHQVEQQQTQIQQLEQALAAQQQQQQKLEEAWASVSQALETLSAQAQTPTESAASSSDTQPFEQTLAQWQSEVSARLNQLNEALANGAATGQTQADIARFEQDVAQQVAQLKAQLEQLNQNQQAWVEEWGPKIRSLGEHLNGLAQAQAQWIERLKPQIEEAVTEIQPQLDGFFSRFNQLFTIHKHEAQSAPAESAQ